MQKADTNAQNQNSGIKKYCKFCDKDNHTTEKCFLLKKERERIKNIQSRIHEVNDIEEENETQQKN